MASKKRKAEFKVSIDATEIETINFSVIDSDDSTQVRYIPKDDARVKKLVKRIKAEGLHTPLNVFPLDNDRYCQFASDLQYAALQAMEEGGVTVGEVPCVIHAYTSDEDMLAIAFKAGREVFKRSKADNVWTVYNLRKSPEMTQEKAAKLLGISVKTVSRYEGVFKAYEDVKESFKADRISYMQAIIIAEVDDEDDRSKLIEECASDDGLTVRDLRKRVDELNGKESVTESYAENLGIKTIEGMRITHDTKENIYWVTFPVTNREDCLKKWEYIQPMDFTAPDMSGAKWPSQIEEADSVKADDNDAKEGDSDASEEAPKKPLAKKKVS